MNGWYLRKYMQLSCLCYCTRLPNRIPKGLNPDIHNLRCDTEVSLLHPGKPDSNQVQPPRYSADIKRLQRLGEDVPFHHTRQFYETSLSKSEIRNAKLSYACNKAFCWRKPAGARKRHELWCKQCDIFVEAAAAPTRHGSWDSKRRSVWKALLKLVGWRVASPPLSDNARLHDHRPGRQRRHLLCLLWQSHCRVCFLTAAKPVPDSNPDKHTAEVIALWCHYPDCQSPELCTCVNMKNIK